ncbi:hypothetical protein EB001_20675 [bacterium]|nr:hypothetical protein [bacterium]
MRILAEKIKDIAFKEFMLLDDYFLLYESIGEYDNDVRVRIPECSKAKRELDWEARMKVDDSIRMCLKHVVEGKIHV